MINLIITCFSIFFCLLLIPPCCASSLVPLPAFPGAEGFGAISVGGRGGRIIKVTNLEGNGTGSLRAACEAEGPRIVVFEVGGVIRGDIPIKDSRITIAGQSAPAPGITLEGRLLSRPEPQRRLHDIIVRFIRVRPRPATGVGGDAVQLPDTERVMLDHLSLSWANDETIDICKASEVSIQWCTIEESDIKGHAKGGFHNFGLISAYPGSGNISIHHNLFAHQSRRSPSLTPYVVGKPGDFRNNIVYNFMEGLTHDGHKPVEAINLVNNFYLKGADTDRILPFAFHRQGKYYLDGNVFQGVETIEGLKSLKRAPKWLRIVRRGKMLDALVPVAPIHTHSAREAYEKVLELAGSFPRDRVTVRTIREVRERSGSWGRHAPAEPGDDWYLKGLERSGPQADSDKDGMPDAWEEAHGLNKFDASDHASIMAGGYTAVEAYLNARAAALVEGVDALRQE